MKDEIIHAYDAVQPAEDACDRMLENILQGTASRLEKKRRTGRRILLVAACVGLVAALSGLGFAAYQKWSLPEPKTYKPDSENGAYEVHEEKTYTEENISVSAKPELPAESEAAAEKPAEHPVPAETAAIAPESEDVPAETSPAAPSRISDEEFIRKAAAVLNTVGLSDINTEIMTVKRQTALSWDREEVAVEYPADENLPSVTFDAESGILLGLSNIEWIDTPAASACKGEGDALRLAEQYYAALPVPQGWKYTNVTKYDDQFWSFEFCNEPLPGVVNQYEMVRLAVNPRTGKLVNLVVFNVPLLDDHGPDDEPLTQGEAEKVCETLGRIDLNRFTLEKAAVEIVLPNWFFTDKMPADGSTVYSDVSRLAWVVVYRTHGDFIESETRFYVDYYTGELLGGDMY